jgi:outer membrane lipoprotein-sorting protein
MIIASGYAQPKGYKVLKDSTAFIKKFNEKSKSILSNEADFTQEKYISVMTDKAISKGKFYYKKPDQMRWETVEPQSHVIVLSNGKMMIREKGKVKTYDAASNKMFKGLNDMMLTTASGNMLQNKEYRYRLFENEHYFLIQLFPTAGATKKFVRVIEIQVEKSDYTVSQIKMIEPSEDYTSISFTNKKINASVTDDKFILK